MSVDGSPDRERVDVDALLVTARRAAAAGAAVLAGLDEWRLDATTTSSDSDWVTPWDLAAERAVRAVLSAERPDDAVSGEELGLSGPDAGATPAGDTCLRWPVDPLDDTTNVFRGIVDYATSVAVVGADGRWLTGVVTAPALGVEYGAAVGHGAWRRHTGDTTGDPAHDAPHPERRAGCWVHRPTAATAGVDPAGQWREEGITAATSRHETQRLDLA